MKVELTLQELIFTVFPIYDDSLHAARVAYSHYTCEHHTGLARQVISEDLAKQIISLDPNEDLTHVQWYKLDGAPPFCVLWLKDEWLTSTERRKIHIANRLKRVAETEAKDLEARWLRDLAKSMCAATAIPLDACVARIQLNWKQRTNINAMLAFVTSVENLFSCKFWVEPPQELVNNKVEQKVEHEHQNQNPIPSPAQDPADSGADQEAEQAPEESRSAERQDGCA